MKSASRMRWLMRLKRKRSINPEEAIVRFAKRGMLGSAGKTAIQESHNLGLSVTIIENGNVVKWHPDGSKTVLAAASQAINTYPTGKLYIK